jgi:hypothetical protein
MLIGPAADEAATFYEAADWIGIAVSPSTRSILENSVDKNRTNPYYRLSDSTKDESYLDIGSKLDSI